ncbi:redoxin domain-containing protein [Candidatus Sumerlaeota bacterium]|nr:redoxin domain-containing protein [Candidatus Sumerlaeota bacterium]
MSFHFPFLTRLSFLLIAFLFATGCKAKGPLLSMDDAPPQVPAGVLPENAELRPRNSLLSAGGAVPAFALPDQKGNTVSASEITASKGAVIIVVPKDASPAARPAYAWARDNNNLLRSRGIEPVIIAPNSPNVNSVIAMRENLHVAVLSDAGGWVSRSFGAKDTLAVFVAGSDGRIHSASKSLPDAAQLIMAAETLPAQKDKSFFLP